MTPSDDDPDVDSPPPRDAPVAASDPGSPLDVDAIEDPGLELDRDGAAPTQPAEDPHEALDVGAIDDAGLELDREEGARVRPLDVPRAALDASSIPDAGLELELDRGARDASPASTVAVTREGRGADPRRRFAAAGWLFGRGLGLVFLSAFASFHVQMIGLVGDRGILPASRRLVRASDLGLGFSEVPTLGWWVGATDGSLHLLAGAGELAAALLLLGVLPGPMALLATLLYLSLVTLGGPFMAFQWDSLLVEVGLASALFLPWLTPWHRPGAALEPPPLARWLLYLVGFRLVFLSGVVKLRSGDPTWSSLRALEFHYFTQPLPNPVSWLAHQLPDAVHAASTGLTLALELALPFAIFFGVRGRRAAFAALAGLMAIIALTGNYGFFNLLSIVLFLPLLDDAAIRRLTPGRLRGRLAPGPARAPRWARWLGVPATVALLVLGQTQLLLGLGAGPHLPEPLLEPLGVASRVRAVNGYGLFAVMTTTRREIVVEGSMDGQTWRAYRFAHKPGDPTELPGISAPHMPRLDWQMWFAALGEYRHSPWLHALLQRLLEAEPTVLALLAHDPFEGRPPRFVRTRIADYELGDWALLTEEGRWWRVGEPAPYGPTLARRAR